MELSERRSKTQQSAGKPIFFGMHKSIIYIDYLEKGKNVVSIILYSIIGPFEQQNQENKSTYVKEKSVLFYEDNAKSHTSMKAKAKLN